MAKILTSACIILTLSTTLTLLLLHSFLSNEDEFHYAFAIDKMNLSDFNFAAAGDWGCSSDTKNTVTNIVDKNPELVLGLGDYSYRNKADCWLEIVDPIDDKMKIALGNHDHLAYISNTTTRPAPERLEEYMNHFNLSRQFYSFDYQNVHFIAISTEVPYDKGSKQFDFVKKDLQKTVSDSSIDWIVVFYHRLAYASPSLIDSIKEIRETYHPLFEKHGVDLVIQAHAHNYQRTYPIKFNQEKSLEPLVVDKNFTNYSNPGGQIFTIVGTAGSESVHNFTGPAAPFTAVQFNAFGFLDINVIRNGTALEGTFYENNGTIRDHFTVTKPKPKNDNNQLETSSSSSSSSASRPSFSQPTFQNGIDKKFGIETVVMGLKQPTDIAFLGPQDILILEQRNGTVQRVVNGQVLEEPLLDVNVANKVERGLLGTAILKNSSGTTYVYLYYTESEREGNDICPKVNYCIPGTEPIGNRLYRYELAEDGTKLIEPKLLLDLPAAPGPGHNGGKMIVDDNKNIFIIVGDVMGNGSKTQNYKDGKEPVGTGGILRIDQQGNWSKEGLLGSNYPLNLYYAYGIRNGFGLDFDPVTGNLWDTENGPEFGDEINLVIRGFNSGWNDAQGIWNHKSGKAQKGLLDLDGLEDFNGKGKYSNPEFTWNQTVGPTSIKFFDSDKMGADYEDSLFVGDFKNGNLYHFNLNEDRSALLLDGTLADMVADTPEELEKIIFASGFRGITDLEVGPDGYLYVLSYHRGAIYRIVPI